MQGCPEYMAGARILQERDDTQPIRSYARLDREGDLFIDLIVRTNRVHSVMPAASFSAAAE